VTSEIKNKNGSKTPVRHQAKQKPEWGKDFVECHLGEKDKVQVRQAVERLDELMDGFERLIQNGYKVSIAVDDRNDNYGAYCTIKDPNSPNYPYMLVGRGPSAVGAIAALLYKHTVMLDGMWASEVERTQGKDGWD